MEKIDIKQIRKKLNLTQENLADRLGISTRALQKWEAGGTIPQSKYKLIEQLIANNQNADNTASFLKGEKMVRPIFKEEKVTMVPLINIDSVGGMEGLNKITISEMFIESLVPFTEAREDDICIYQSGDSMAPAITAGSILLIRQIVDWQSYIGYGNTFVLLLRDGRRLTKQVLKYAPDPRNYITCHSFNPEYADEELPRELISAVYKVIKVISHKGW